MCGFKCSRSDTEKAKGNRQNSFQALFNLFKISFQCVFNIKIVNKNGID